ncbi:unnamed protein product [Nesidiocoris tenuis]|uniref:Uncharacterized protein n=1 Tax=Nesidiocoris tenuis TaxID=355587 RepID=A0A6H5G733_9HEMI|nr:unnamed protein product [Nesidiocoris tenuis]
MVYTCNDDYYPTFQQALGGGCITRTLQIPIQVVLFDVRAPNDFSCYHDLRNILLDCLKRPSSSKLFSCLFGLGQTSTAIRNPITYNVARSGQSKTNYYNDSKQIQPAELLEFLWRRICSN